MSNRKRIVAAAIVAAALVSGFAWGFAARPGDTDGEGGTPAPSVSAKARQVGGVSGPQTPTPEPETETPTPEPETETMPESVAGDDPFAGWTEEQIAEYLDAEGTHGCPAGSAGCMPAADVLAAAEAAGQTAKGYLEALYTWPEGNLDAWLANSAPYATQQLRAQDAAYHDTGWQSDRDFFTRYSGSCRGRAFETWPDTYKGGENTTSDMWLWVTGRIECVSLADTEEEKRRKESRWSDKRSDVQTFEAHMVRTGQGWLVDTWETTDIPLDNVGPGMWAQPAENQDE